MTGEITKWINTRLVWRRVNDFYTVVAVKELSKWARASLSYLKNKVVHLAYLEHVVYNYDPTASPEDLIF